jgi:hypothetical protein
MEAPLKTHSKIGDRVRLLLTAFAVVIGMLLMMGVVKSCLEEEKVSTGSGNRFVVSSQRQEKRTPEHNLAIIHEGWEVPEDHTTVFRFRYLLQQLDAQCIQSKEEIADMTVWAQERIRKERGIKMNLLSMMEEMNKTMRVYRPHGGGDYAELLAAEMVVWMNATE